MPIEENVKKFVAGFFDGDGCVFIPKASNSVKHPSPRITFSQAYDSGVPPELAYIKSVYGGRLEKLKAQKEGRRQRWNLNYRSAIELRYILRDLREYCVVKGRQCKIAHRYFRSGKEDTMEARRRVKEAKEALKAEKPKLHKKRICDPWVAGFFAAEGTIGVYEQTVKTKPPFWAIAITRKGCVRVLRKIRNHCGVGSVNKPGYFLVTERNAIFFLSKIESYLVGQKKEQVCIALSALRKSTSVLGVRKSDTEIEDMLELGRELKRLKKL